MSDDVKVLVARARGLGGLSGTVQTVVDDLADALEAAQQEVVALTEEADRAIDHANNLAGDLATLEAARQAPGHTGACDAWADMNGSDCTCHVDVQQAPAVDREVPQVILHTLLNAKSAPNSGDLAQEIWAAICASGILQDASEERRLEANLIANLIAKEATPGMEMNQDGTENRETAAYVEGIRVAHGVARARAQQVREGN